MTHAAAEGGTGVRLAELVASLSFATDLGRGQPMEHSIRRARLALRLADRIGADDDDRIATYYTGLLEGVYCHADANEQAMWFGDDIAMKADTYAADKESLREILLMLSRLGAGESGLARVRRIAEFRSVAGRRSIDGSPRIAPCRVSSRPGSVCRPRSATRCGSATSAGTERAPPTGSRASGSRSPRG